MCGIAGLFPLSVPKPVDAARVGAMTEALAHRGPDGAGVWTSRGIGLGHRRLAIIDLSEGGAQPMLRDEGRLALSFNGEIYNFREVRAELEAKGHQFRTTSDSEVILAAWQQYGEACLEHFNGMFAFALYDESRDALFLARDRLGVKPLYYTLLADGTLAFASELKGLLAHPALRREIDPRAIEDFLAFGYVPEPGSILAGVFKLPAGHYLLARRGGSLPAPIRWWDVDFTPRTGRSLAGLEEEMIDRLRAAVRSRMVADVPTGAFLSGGVDSSAVVAFMAEASGSAIQTCSIGFSESDHDESEHAAVIARRFATDHRSRIVDAADFSLIDRLVDAFDEPFADASALPTFRVCELARERVKVALSGDGADEAMAGYRRHRLFAGEERFRGMLPGPLRGAIGRIGDFYPKLDRAPRFLRARTTLQAIGLESGEAYARAVGVTPPELRARLFRPEFQASLQGYRAEAAFAAVYDGAPAEDSLSRAQYADLKHWLPGDILTKVDRTSMAVSLEAREPLLDHRLVEFAANLPASVRLRGGEGKWLMKRALRGRLPDATLDRTKQGFVTPLSAWFRGPLVAEARSVARGSMLAGTGWFDSAAVERVSADHLAGRVDHGRLLWQLLMLERSLARLLDSAPAHPTAQRAAG